jgi:hypothetical protein
MKSKELIRLLQEADPSGEGHVVVDNKDIFFLEWKPGYWDGRYTVLVRDEKKKPWYDIVGAEYRSDGDKLNVNTMDWEDVLLDNPDAPIKVVDTFVEKRMQKAVDRCRAEMKALYAKLTKEMTEQVLAKLKEGWQIRQPASEMGKAFGMEWFKSGFIKDKKENLCCGECKVVLKSELFEHYTENEFVYWRLK